MRAGVERSPEADADQHPEPATVGDGLLLVDKPQGWTSHDVVAHSRRLCGTRRVGHAGTLDPMATGVLVLGVNRGTKLLTYLVGVDKTYTATIRVGQSTVTDDAEGDVTAHADAAAVTDHQIADAVADLTGPLEQVPSAVSAIKVDGKRSYARVRSGEQVELRARSVTVHRFDVLARRTRHPGDWGAEAEGTTYVDLDVEVEVSSGTYVRALARDLGAALGVGGHLVALRRTRVGRFDLSTTATLEEIRADGTARHLVPLATAAAGSFPTRHLTEEEARALGYGQRIESERPGREQPVAALAPDGTLVAMLDEGGRQARSLAVFAAR
jgi:tRNA pseudouridine55 synthase